MKKKQTKRLELSKETIAMLEQGDLLKAVGGSNTCAPAGCASSNPVTDACCKEH